MPYFHCYSINSIHLSEFLIGNLAGLYFVKKRLNNSKNYDLWILILIISLCILLYSNTYFNFHNGLLAIVFIPLIICISANKGLFTKISKFKSLIFLGEISYGVYILQNPIFAWTRGILKDYNVTNETIKFYASLIMLILIAGLSYKFIEAPMRKAIKQL